MSSLAYSWDSTAASGDKYPSAVARGGKPGQHGEAGPRCSGARWQPDGQTQSNSPARKLALASHASTCAPAHRAAGQQGSRLTRQLEVDVEGGLGDLEAWVCAVPQAHHWGFVDDGGLGCALLQGRGGQAMHVRRCVGRGAACSSSNVGSTCAALLAIDSYATEGRDACTDHGTPAAGQTLLG